MKKSILLFSLTAVLISCKSDDTNLQNFYLNTDSLSVIPFQLVKISSNTIDFSQEEYLADFGMNQIPLAKNDTGDLIFLVPDTPPGDHEFVLTIDGRKGVLSFYVGNNNPNVETTVSENAIETFTAFQNYSTGLMYQYDLTQQTVDRLNSANEMISHLINQYNLSPAVEKEKIAKFLNANTIFTERYDLKRLHPHKASGEYLPFIVNALRLLYLSEVFYSWNELITPAIVQSQTLVPDEIIKVFTVVGMYAFSAHIEASIEMLRDISYYPVSVKLYDDNGNSNNFIMQYNEYTTFYLKVGERRLISDDRNSSDNYIANLAIQIDYIIANWDDFKVINPTIIDSSNWFSEWLSSGSSYVGVSSNIAPLRQSDTVIEVDGNHSFLSFEGTGMLSYGILFVNSNSFSLRFDGDENSLPQTFEMKLKYDIDPFETIIENINISLE